MKFRKLVCVDETKINEKGIEQLRELAEDVVVYHDQPTSSEVIERVKDADAILVSWRTEIDQNIIDSAAELKYIGMACTLFDEDSANVDIATAKKREIPVKGIRDYGDPGVAEFIISELIQLLNGYGNCQWREIPRELTNLKIGIIGMGVTGKLLADCLKPFNCDRYYFSRSRKPEAENDGIKFLELEELLETCDVLSFHIPRDALKLQECDFQTLGDGKILIHTSLGLPFSEKALKKWLKNDNNFAIFDGDGGKELSEEIRDRKNVIFHDKSAGWSIQTQERLSQKVIDNIKEFQNNNS